MYSVNEKNFEDIALRLFRFQAKNNPVYHRYLQYLKCPIEEITSIQKIPFLPISFFKTHEVKTGDWLPQVEFISSGTTGMVTSRHAVNDLSYYLSLSENIFKRFYGPPDQFHFLALLPSYLERTGSSLIAMMDHLINQSNSPYSGFYLHNHADLVNKLNTLKGADRKVVLWGVSFALLELAEAYELDMHDCIVLETGGMKGRRKEWIREELHLFLSKRFNIPAVHSEYGMTELMSQAYSKGGGYYQCPPWMKLLIRDINDPFLVVESKVGGVNVIDLANFHSCAFIETQDLGRIDQNGSFEVLGRIDNSDVRGCNLLVG